MDEHHDELDELERGEVFLPPVHIDNDDVIMLVIVFDADGENNNCFDSGISMMLSCLPLW